MLLHRDTGFLHSSAIFMPVKASRWDKKQTKLQLWRRSSDIDRPKFRLLAKFPFKWFHSAGSFGFCLSMMALWLTAGAKISRMQVYVTTTIDGFLFFLLVRWHRTNFRFSGSLSKIFGFELDFLPAVRCGNQTRNGWVRRVSATSVLCHLPIIDVTLMHFF